MVSMVIFFQFIEYREHLLYQSLKMMTNIKCLEIEVRDCGKGKIFFREKVWHQAPTRLKPSTQLNVL